MPKTLLSALEREVSGHDTNSEVVEYYCNLAHASK